MGDDFSLAVTCTAALAGDELRATVATETVVVFEDRARLLEFQLVP